MVVKKAATNNLIDWKHRNKLLFAKKIKPQFSFSQC